MNLNLRDPDLEGALRKKIQEYKKDKLDLKKMKIENERMKIDKMSSDDVTVMEVVRVIGRSLIGILIIVSTCEVGNTISKNATDRPVKDYIETTDERFKNLESKVIGIEKIQAAITKAMIKPEKQEADSTILP